MKKCIGFLLLSFFCRFLSVQPGEYSVECLHEMALQDLPAFSKYVAGAASSDLEKTDRTTTWFAQNSDCTATVYKNARCRRSYRAESA